MDLLDTLEKIVEKLGCDNIREWYEDTFVLYPETYTTSLSDYCGANNLMPWDIEIAPIHADGISFGWLGMALAYKQFNEKARKFDAVVDFREYPGEYTLFGIVREWRMMGTGVKIKRKKKRW